MRKKGFTLIELLAVIIILAIIALIAVPIVMRVVENSKKSAAERSAENYTREVETLIVAERLNGNVIEDGIYELDGNGNICLDSECDKKLVVTMNGTKPSSGKIQIKGEKVIASSLTIGGYENTYGTIPLLPEEYQEVEYIESTGTQYIDNIFTPNLNNFIFEIEQIQTLNNTGNNQYLLNGFIVYQKDMPSLFFGGNYNSISSTTSHIIKGIFTNNIGSLYVDGDLIYDNVAASNFTFINKLVLFNRDGYDRPAKAKCKYLKIYQNEKLVRDFIPCYSITTVTDVNDNECSEGTRGMYDLVEGKFYTNQGSGVFEIGEEV